MLSGPQGDTSVKRVIALLCSIALIVCLFLKKSYDSTVVNSVTTVILTCIAGTVAEKFSPHITDTVNTISSTTATDNQ